MSMESVGVAYYLTLVAAGLSSGFAGGLFGIGGGLLRVPILLYVFHSFGVSENLTFHLAAGTSLAVAIPTSMASAYRQYKAQNLDFAFLKTWIPWLVLGVVAGILISYVSSSSVLKEIFVGLLGIMAIYFLLPSRPHIANEIPKGFLRGLMAAVIGGLSTLLGLSGGVLTTPSLVACNATMHRAVAVSSAGSLAVSIVAAAGMVWTGYGVAGAPSWTLGYVDLPALALMTPTVIVTAPLGVRLANFMRPRALELAFVALLIALGIDMAVRLALFH